MKTELKEKLIRTQNNKGETSFVIACQNKLVEVALLLLDEADIADSDGWNGLMWATYKGLINVVEAILSKPELREKLLKKQNKYGDSALMIATKQNFDCIAVLLIEESNIIDNNGNTALIIAAYAHNIKIMKELIPS